MSRFGRCIHCREPLDSPDFHSCSRCCQLLAELGDTVVNPPTRQPGSDDDKRPARKRDGRWLAWAAAKRGRTRDVFAIGRERGFPRDIRQWSPAMVAICVEALAASKSTR